MDDLVMRAGSAPPPLLQDAIAELDIALEELTVALEELHEQNDELAATRTELESERRYYRELFDLAPDAYLLTDPRGMIHEVNDATARLLAVPRRRLVGHPITTLVPADERQDFRAGLNRLLIDGSRRDWAFALEPPTRSTLLVSANVSVGYDSNAVVTDLRWVLHDVTEARRAQQLLQEQFTATTQEAAHLREAHRWKDAFMAAAAHDLRSPLAVIEAGADTLMARPDVPEATRASMLQSIHTASRRLQRLLDDLLDLDRFARGAVAAERHAVALDDLVDRVVRAMQITSHPVDVKCEVVVAEVDAPRVEQMLQNLVGNAVHHTPSGTAIDVALARTDDGIRVVVEDRGPGIPKDVLANVFEPFVTSRTHPGDERGTGLGLSLVLLFAQLHGGTASAEQRDGGGARFVVDIPAPADTAG